MAKYGRYNNNKKNIAAERKQRQRSTHIHMYIQINTYTQHLLRLRLLLRAFFIFELPTLLSSVAVVVAVDC